jgi:hypothetical protein
MLGVGCLGLPFPHAGGVSANSATAVAGSFSVADTAAILCCRVYFYSSCPAAAALRTPKDRIAERVRVLVDCRGCQEWLTRWRRSFDSTTRGDSRPFMIADDEVNRREGYLVSVGLA